MSEDRVLETAQIAALRLAPLGLSTLVVDLGWQSGNLPSAFEENERFGHGLRWLADQLKEHGLQLDAWCAPYSISELDPIAAEHPQYLVQDEDGQPASTGTWFWEPHGKVHRLDLTHPGASRWLRDRMTSLAARGVAYLKPDFIGCVSHPVARHRHDRTIAAGGTTETGRIGAQIIQEAMPETRVLNCGGPEMPGTGAHPLFYSCDDTGNTGFLSTDSRRRNTQSLACHLWKNQRWSILQPSCFCVGLPGTMEEARLRATIAFLAGGQIDISDTLQSLPEDRWEILYKTLPPLGVSARPVDLFEPLPSTPFGYETSTRGEDQSEAKLPDLPAGTVWHLPVDAGWDQWDLIGIFSMPDDTDSEAPAITRFVIPLDLLGLAWLNASTHVTRGPPVQSPPNPRPVVRSIPDPCQATNSGRGSIWTVCLMPGHARMTTAILGTSRTCSAAILPVASTWPSMVRQPNCCACENVDPIRGLREPGSTRVVARNCQMWCGMGIAVNCAGYCSDPPARAVASPSARQAE